MHSEKSGVAHFVLPNDILCLRETRRLIHYLPSNNRQRPPILDLRDPPERTDPALDDLVPVNPNQPYDMKILIDSILDGAEFMEVQSHFARNLIVGFGRLGGGTIGLIANQPAVLAGVLDKDASVKGARFVRFCDAFNIPLVCLVDVPGFMPGPEQEHGGIIRHGAKLLYAFVEATVPRITVVVRKAYGGAYVVMNSKHIGADINYAWPSAEIAVLGPRGAAEVIYRREIEGSEDPAAHPPGAGAALPKDLREPFPRRETRLYRRCHLPAGYEREAHSEPSGPRRKTAATVQRRKHGNIPL